MCTTCNPDPEQSYENWMLHHKVNPGVVTSITDNDLAIDAIMSSRLQTFSVEELIENYHLQPDRAHTVVHTANKLVSQIEACLLDSISRE